MRSFDEGPGIATSSYTTGLMLGVERETVAARGWLVDRSRRRQGGVIAKGRRTPH